MRVRSSRSSAFLTLHLILTALIPALFLTGTVTANPQSHGSTRAAAARGSLYFPLRHGYKWTYVVKSPISQTTTTWQVEVLSPPPSATPVSGYYPLRGYFRMDETRAVRATPFGTVVEQGPEGERKLWYELDAQVGESWTMHVAPPLPSCEDGAVLTMTARDERVSVPAGDFSRVLRVDRLASQCADAGIVSEWFAPGVGLIRREEQTIAGPVISELVSAELGNDVWPASSYTTALHLSKAQFFNDLMPPVDPDTLAHVRGTFVMANRAAEVPTEFVFSGCKSLTLEIQNAEGTIVRKIEVDDGGCCECDSLVTVDLSKEPLRLAFDFVLVDTEGKPLPDGFYSLTAVLNSQDPPALRPAARARIEVASAH